MAGETSRSVQRHRVNDGSVHCHRDQEHRRGKQPEEPVSASATPRPGSVGPPMGNGRVRRGGDSRTRTGTAGNATANSTTPRPTYAQRWPKVSMRYRGSGGTRVIRKTERLIDETSQSSEARRVALLNIACNGNTI
jgi:hypothetical protein